MAMREIKPGQLPCMGSAHGASAIPHRLGLFNINETKGKNVHRRHGPRQAYPFQLSDGMEEHAIYSASALSIYPESVSGCTKYSVYMERVIVGFINPGSLMDRLPNKGSAQQTTLRATRKLLGRPRIPER